MLYNRTHEPNSVQHEPSRPHTWSLLRLLGLEKSPPLPRILLVDDDEAFLLIMQKVAMKQRIHLDCFSSIHQIDPKASHDYDVALIDFNLGNATGPELVRYLSYHCSACPTLILSGSVQKPGRYESWPSQILGFVHKQYGPKAIMERAHELYRKIYM